MAHATPGSQRAQLAEVVKPPAIRGARRDPAGLTKAGAHAHGRDDIERAARGAREAGRGRGQRVAGARLVDAQVSEGRHAYPEPATREHQALQNGVTHDPSTLVNEAWLKLRHSPRLAGLSHLHFKRIAARAMRQVLIEEELARLQPRQAFVVESRFSGGFDVAESAELLGVSEATILRDWRAAKAWLAHQLRQAS